MSDNSFNHTLSLTLSNVLSHIGINEKAVSKCRRVSMLRDSMSSTTQKMLNQTKLKIYDIGSISEGTTTLGLHSDTDVVLCNEDLNIINDLNDWKPGKHNLLIVQDDTTAPGYCKLQLFRDNYFLPVSLDLEMKHTTIGKHWRLQELTHSVTSTYNHGPAYLEQALIHFSQPVHIHSCRPESDVILAFRCNSLPAAAQSWLKRQGIGSWPSSDLRQSATNSGCFLVPVGMPEEGMEWRISTSLFERHLMSKLNITQIKCYVLMKMIVKTFITPFHQGSISIYHIKTVLFHCIQMTNEKNWKENNLVTCLEKTLWLLYYFFSNKNCPHFIIYGQNLLRRYLDENSTHYDQLLDTISNIIESKGTALLSIQIDDLGMRLQIRLSSNLSIPSTQNYLPMVLDYQLAESITWYYKQVLETVLYSSSLTVIHQIKKCMHDLVSIYREGNKIEKEACTYLAPLFSSMVGSAIASEDIETNNIISQEAYTWLSVGKNSDVSSGRLKLASALYCAGDLTGSESLLRETLREYSCNNAQPVCSCTTRMLRYNYKSTDSIKESTAYCILFLRCEENCVPQELRYEMFRSSQDDMLPRYKHHYWMDCAAVDSLPYLYFLQYKVYKQLGRDVEKKRALTTLADITDTEPNLGHKETALNLLGQCMEQENRLDDALCYYMLSLQVRERNNAVNIHICRLLAKIQIQRTYDVNSLNTSCGREEQRHNLSNLTATSSEGQPDVQSACGHQSSNLFKKGFENTLNERLVDDMSVKMKSVGAIVYEGVRGTVFRVGSKYIMTALHVVTGITNPRKRQDIPENDWSKLEEPTVWVTFAAQHWDLQSPPFYLKRDVIFMDKRLDVAVVELKPGNVLPQKLKLSKEIGQIEHVNLIGFGHPTDPRKQLDPKCEVVTMTDQLFRRIQTESENILQRYSLRTVLPLHGLDPNLLTGSYNDLFEREKFVCHAAMEHGASGAPAIAENEVVGLFVKGLPKFYYELKSRASTAQYVQHFPNHLKFELCSKTEYIYRILRHTNPMLAENLFD
ncbi:uncharacterized protein LOC123547583 [Mercenaria mercenaria]|uniref:uncharacterized protein LOC123547583 n=1 Tax=Mercenaria mercenaria TaxID=6596 RepID=UPI00234EF1BC|nr:uncharacterized protein LOC123547583 [Mercenaria mercenaria]XP_053407826.1 uncharacterized protein LOC123547583 [Mercenaria mercenaria]